VIKYLGSKRSLVPLIEEVARALPIRSACDLFAGTTRVGQAFRRAGVQVHSNDTATYSEPLGYSYIVDDGAVDRARLRRLLADLDALPGRPGYFTETFCERSRFFQPHNGARVDAIREAIDAVTDDPVERGLLLTSLLEAADRVDSTCGLQMAYVKQWAARSYEPLRLREPTLVAGPAGRVSRSDAETLAGALDVDCTYLDPPYNQHSYYANYHVWETLVRWDAPDHYGVACKRVDVRTTKSRFNSRRTAWDALQTVVERLQTPWLVVSLSDEGFHDPDAVAALLAEKGHVASLSVDFKRYVGAQIGIHDPSGRKVGTVSHLRNTETLFVVGPERAQVRDAVSRAAQLAPFGTSQGVVVA
jgi:adenine-specific DNA-methyltransferase